ncbi:MAG: DNA-directed RNA polymerase subunit omega [Selenomonadaceae bacterium]|nr:DNA-directed RNA polymerase subunit omega [Selenomonadaceae bacterium]
MKTVSAPHSMVNPSTDDMLKKTHSRYTLVVLASKRARQLLTGEACHLSNPSEKFVTDAMEEIYEGKITYSMPGVSA